MVQVRWEQGIPVNPNLRQELQIMRDELDIKGYGAYWGEPAGASVPGKRC